VGCTVRSGRMSSLTEASVKGAMSACMVLRGVGSASTSGWKRPCPAARCGVWRVVCAVCAVLCVRACVCVCVRACACVGHDVHATECAWRNFVGKECGAEGTKGAKMSS
jgi:hypothetical protein